ncbi:uncharacterized protein LOC115414184 isoform X1 [Sphaeramia orbicularis]|uniref:uncharacterized protein LOC115414184 isoform X1 n=1 Tax=Sphaeramia orbicularis TaxID=375764 RepID=UPI0011805A7B|nr:uncharacterized protein LOC115414184 isoform X1 [Sphaeramia orbicularis]
MLLRVCLVFLLHVVTVNPYSTFRPYYSTILHTVLPRPENVQLLAIPDYPVAEGQRVDMHCTADDEYVVSNWTWDRMNDNGTVTTVGRSKDLTLTEPEQSGQYRCSAGNLRGFLPSSVHTVYIVSIQAKASENLGIAGFVLSLLALIINLAVVLWLVWQKLYSTLTVSQTSTTGPSKPVTEPKEGFQQDGADRDVYMNYTSSNQAYSDLDPKNMTDDNLYSSLS